VIIQNGCSRVVVDSSGWVEYMANGVKANSFAAYLESTENLLLPSIVVYEVHRKLIREQGKHMADTFLSQAFAFGERLVDLTLEIAILASRTSLETGLPMADAIIYSTAHHYRAELVTSDSHFAKLDGVTLL
jgi:toxin FitB